jgi:hypothetical protein
MMVVLMLKAGSLWLLLAALAVVNGIFREKLLVPVLGPGLALPLSGITLSLLIFAVAYVAVPWFGVNPVTSFLLIGVQWVLMTLLFEFLFGHYVSGKSWQDLLQVFNILKGDLFLVVLVISLFAPCLVARVRGLCKCRT